MQNYLEGDIDDIRGVLKDGDMVRDITQSSGIFLRYGMLAMVKMFVTKNQ